MSKALPFFLAALLAAIGGLLNATAFVREALPTSDVLGAVVAGQVCWLAAGLICLTQASRFASERISYDGPWIAVFSTAKWTLTTILILADAFLMERAWEVVYILPR